MSKVILVTGGARSGKVDLQNHYVKTKIIVLLILQHQSLLMMK